MLVSTFVFRVISSWWMIVKIVLLNPFKVLKVGFLWFCMSFATSYLFFLVVHKSDVVDVRKSLAMELFKSLFMGFFLSCLLISLYQFLITNVMSSQFFASQSNLIQDLSIWTQEFDLLSQKLVFLMVMLSGLFATHYVADLLDTWHEPCISERYGWTIMTITFLCLGFLWVVNFII